MSVCDSNTKIQVESAAEYRDLEKTLVYSDQDTGMYWGNKLPECEA